VRQALESVARQTGKIPDALNIEPLPPECEYLWRWFRDLSGSRTIGFGINPITYLDILAWSRLTGVRPEPWEVRIIRDIDTTLLASKAKESEDGRSADRAARAGNRRK
jgi:hypothetical protein